MSKQLTRSRTKTPNSSKRKTKEKTNSMTTDTLSEITHQLIFTMGGRGGVGKTSSIVAIADYLHTRGHKFLVTDCDTENAGKTSSISHWFKDVAIPLNLRSIDDCDKLLDGSSKAKAPYVLADLPSNAAGDLAPYWKGIITPETLAELGLGVIAVGVITPSIASGESVYQWIDTLGPNIQYLIALNRLSFERVPAPKEETFKHWFALNTDHLMIKTFEIPHLYDPDMEAMTQLGKLPSKVYQGRELFILPRQRIKQWRDAIHAQLDATGLFSHRNGDTP
jgi:CobQ/CobB/MinD/ParA nucleotide binding domain